VAPSLPEPAARRLRRLGGRAAVALGAVVLAACATAVLAFSEEVTILARRHDAEARAAARAAFDPRDDVAELYGVPEGRPVRVVFPDPDGRIVPPEAPGRVLLAVDRVRGRSPLLARTLLAVGAPGGALLVLAGAALALGARRASDPAARG
jgi:hypothetical protein